jgi:hypothetical protein
MPCWERARGEQWIWDGTPLEGRRYLTRAGLPGPR